jgi:hypothetical protein
MKQVPEGKSREDALKRIEKLNPDIFGPEANAGETLAKGRADKGTYQKALADQLNSLPCSGDKDASYIVRGLASNGRIYGTGAQAAGLAHAILKDCRSPRP